MLRYRKNLAIIAAISLALNLQGVGAVADEASSSGTVGNGKFTVTSSKIKAGQERSRQWTASCTRRSRRGSNSRYPTLFLTASFRDGG